MKEKAVKICPKCKSKNLMFDLGGQSGKHTCKDCGYTGAFIIEKYKKYEVKKWHTCT